MQAQRFAMVCKTDQKRRMFNSRMCVCAGARQAARLRERFLERALHQDIAYYDTTLTSGAVLGGLNVDCTAIQNALSEKVRLFLGRWQNSGPDQ